MSRSVNAIREADVEAAAKAKATAFRQLLRKWHPDKFSGASKGPGDDVGGGDSKSSVQTKEQAAKVFHYVKEREEWFIDD